MARLVGIAVAVLLAAAGSWSSVASAGAPPHSCTLPPSSDKAAHVGAQCGDPVRGMALYLQATTPPSPLISLPSQPWACNQCHGNNPLNDPMNFPVASPSLMNAAPRDPGYIQVMMHKQPNAEPIMFAMEACANNGCLADRPPSNVMGDLGDIAEFLYTCNLGIAPCVAGGGGGGGIGTVNVDGLWWNAPGGSESGWGINLAHEGDSIFASWFTYDVNGRGWWLVMTAQKYDTNAYQGQLFETTGPAFNSTPFLSGQVKPSPVGTATLIFTDANSGSFTYSITKGGAPITQSKYITRQNFGPTPVCTFGAQTDLTVATNYQDIWWNAPSGSESGWGVNFSHQGNTIFLTWFTYDIDGTPMWLVATAPQTTNPAVYSGPLFRTAGARFDAFSPGDVVVTPVGNATLTFANGNNATFAYTVQVAGMSQPVSQSKTITREIITSPGTVCK